jgi:uncharacterized phage protein gp47/JayE
MSKIAVNDLNTGGAMISFFEAVAQAIYRANGDVLQIFRDFSVDRAQGEALQRLAQEERVFPIPATVATGRVTIQDSSFQKISTKVYGIDPVNKGSLFVYASDASNFPNTGSIYIGRQTPNIEGPIAYNSIIPVGSFYQINLATPTTKFHNASETIILSQGGNRAIEAGQVVRTSASGSTTPISFITTKKVTILDGENEVTNVPIAAQAPGTDGNVPAGAIKEFISVPFTGATVINPNKLDNGKNQETDEELRDRIKKARLSRGLGTATAIQAAVQGVQSDFENAIVTSSQILRTASQTTLFFDDGTGYEEVVEGVGLEVLVDSALGGEQFFQLATGGSQTSVAKAFLKTGNATPFALQPNDRLSLLIGGVLSEHVFAEGDFRANGAATAYEVVASINANPALLFSADTSDDGTRVILFAKSETNEFIQKTDPSSGNDAGVVLALPASEVETLYLYQDDVPLSRNGRTAQLESENQNDWAITIADGDTLILKVDNTSYITYTFLDADFIAQGDFTTVSKNNSLQSWVDVINAKVIGVTASINGTRLVLTSNLGTNSRAGLEIDPASTLVAKGVFTAQMGLSAFGKEADYTLNRNTAQLELARPLPAGAKLAAGSENTEGRIMSEAILGGATTLSADGALWFLVDINAQMVPNGVINDSIIHFTKQGSNIIRVRSALVNAFGAVQEGDYVILWDTALNAPNRLEGRVYSVGTDLLANDYFEIKVTAAEYAAASNQTPLVFGQGIAFVRTASPPQKVSILAGSYSISNLASQIQDQVDGVEVTTLDDEFIIVSSVNKSSEGSVLLVTFNEGAQPLNFTLEDSGTSTRSLYGFTQTESAPYFPRFIHSSVATDAYADPSTSFISTFDSALNLSGVNVDPNEILCVKHPYETLGSFVQDAQAVDQCAQLDSISGVTLDIANSKVVKRLRVDDRYYLLRALDLDANDQLIAILDGDSTDKTFAIKMYRNLITNAGMPINSSQFRAYDQDAGASVEFEEFFGADFNFANYKLLMKARYVVDPLSLVDEDALLIRSALWGRSGERIRVGYFYPTSANQEIFSVVSVGERTDVRIFLKSGDPVANTIDGTTEWDVTITPESASVDQVTYTWNSVGTNPAMATLQPGHYVSINSAGEFDPANTGTFKVLSATSTSFTVRRPVGVAVAENNIATLTSGTISLYEDNDTTAAEINTYINDNLSEWITSEIVDDNGTTGAGIIDESTHEDSEFIDEVISLVDGINWISVSDLDAIVPNPNFTLKIPLAMPSYDTNTINAYAFNDGEVCRLIPTTVEQVKEFISILAVSGITTLGEVQTVKGGDVLEISTQTLGSEGSVRISGGSANSLAAEILGSASIVDNIYTRVSVSQFALSGISAGSVLKLSATNKQAKNTGFSETTQVTIIPNDPAPNVSTISLANRDVTDRFFGEPRNIVRDRNRVFHVEKHGPLVCISWNQVGSSPVFAKTVEINDSLGGTIDVSFNSDFNTTEYEVTAGDINFAEVKAGDSVIIQGFVNDSNNGSFVVAGISDDGTILSVNNSSGINEIGTVIASGDIEVATEVSEGDTVIIGAPFDPLNQGQYKVIRRYLDSIYIENDSVVEERVEVVDNLVSIGVANDTELDVIVNGNMTIEWNGNGTQPTLENARIGDILYLGTAFDPANQGEFLVVDSGDNFVTVQNALAVAESAVIVSGVGADIIEIHRPALKFFAYDDTVPGDSFVITGNVLTSANVGSFTVTEVLSKTKAVVSSILAPQTSVQLNALFTQVFVEEGEAYTAYKEVYNVAVNPANLERAYIVFEGVENFSKINDSADVFLSSVGKLAMPEQINSGFDAYKYHVGLMAEVNKTIYGDPRDNVTYPGTAAAGANIFHRPPLKRRIVVSINVRVQTGVPFARITEKVRNNIAALINSNPIGESIAISDIISTVNSIPGVRAVSITSPQYDPQNDVIVVNQSEKALILDLINDITVSTVGN